MLPLSISLAAACAVACIVAVMLRIRLRRAQSLILQMNQLAVDVTEALRDGERTQSFSYRAHNPHLLPCWQVKQCARKDCVAYGNPDLRCWHLVETLCREEDGAAAMGIEQCEQCDAYLAAQPDAFWRFAEQLNNILMLLGRSFDQVADSERRVEQASKLATLGEFAAGLAHEINNPLDGTMSCLIRLERDPANLTQNMEYLQLMREALERISMVVQHILDYSRKRDILLEEIDVHNVLEDVVALIKVTARQKALTLRFELAEDLPPVRADKYHLSEAFLNLAVNSISATPEGGTLTFRTRLTTGENGAAGRVAVDVVDTGAGIEPRHLPKVFEPFFTTKEPGKGTGLGLSTVKEIVVQHHGEISIDSAPQEGTTVSVMLPAAVEDGGPSGSTDDPGSGQGK